MRRAACPPLAGPRSRAARLEGWDHVPACAGAEEGGQRDLQRRLLAYGLGHCLTPAQREAVELCYGCGLSVTQAARNLGVHPSTVSRRLSGAMARLRRLTAG